MSEKTKQISAEEKQIQLDKTDIAILNLLLENARLSYRQIAAKLGISTATVMKRINHLESRKVIQGYTTKIDYEKVGYNFHILVEMRISHGKLKLVEEKIAKLPNVFLVYDKTGSFDATIGARFKTRRAMDEFLKKIQTFDFVERTNTALILNIVKDESMKL